MCKGRSSRRLVIKIRRLEEAVGKVGKAVGDGTDVPPRKHENRECP